MVNAFFLGKLNVLLQNLFQSTIVDLTVVIYSGKSLVECLGIMRSKPQLDNFDLPCVI